jgi:uncharacterized protein (TIGR00725 family)
MKFFIGVIGASAHTPDIPNETAMIAAYEVGKLLAEKGAVVLTGGGSGIMEAASKGASEAGGMVAAILPGMDKTEANPYVDIPITTGIGFARNVFCVRASDAVIMISGGTGTLNELTAAANENISPIVLEGTGGWADRVRGLTLDGTYLDERRTTAIHFASNPADAVDLALELGKKRHQPKTE